MSTLLKTAAMGLLSRTLQTLLNKYLLEVDVEGVAMPSLIDIDGHSGWGVRLCNVRLREGVELMTLPGKRTVTKKRLKRKRRSKVQSRHANDDIVVGCDHTQNESPSHLNEDLSNVEKEDLDEQNGMESDLAQLLNDPPQIKRSPRSRIMSEDTDMESALSSRVPSPTLVCQSSVRSAVVGCLSRGRSARDSSNDGNEVETPRAPSSSGAPALRRSLVDQNVVFDTTNLLNDCSLQNNGLFNPIETNSKAVLVQTVADEEGGDTLRALEDDGEEEESYVVEEDMILFLGKAGRIGTLDVRLIGKELHIMVEDAFLTVEACPKREDVDDTSTKTASTAETTKEDSSKTKKKDPKKPSKPAPKKEGVTPGERVLENSVLARAISTIPHLLLRDVRVQLIVRNKAQEADGEFQNDVSAEDSVVEMNVEMLSVASGDDFFANFGNESESKVPANMDDSTSNVSTRQRVSLQVLEERDENEYLFKRIRTGKGPEGGISIKVYPPTKNKWTVSKAERIQDWAFHAFARDAQSCFFRCSGLDIRTRIFLGKQKEVAIRNNDYAWYGEEYDEYTMDSMLFGVEYIAPAPPPLPPLNKTDSFSFAKTLKPEVEHYVTDENGIQSNCVQSCFHKVARGLTPSLCAKDHLPSEHCPYCWEDNARPKSYSEHPLDSRTPLPGIVFNVEITEPIELNVDRSSLEVIGNIQALFATKSGGATPVDNEVSDGDSKPKTTSITQTLKNLAFRKKEKKEILRTAFPSYMKPETIEMIGLFISSIILRVHVMKHEDIYDQGLAFRYWEVKLQCATADIQMHTSKEKSFHDIRCDLGYITTNDYFGIERNRLLSIGALLRDNDDSVSLRGILSKNTSKERTCWPSTAAILLQVPSVAGVSEFESRESHGLQIRILSVGGNEIDVRTATMNVRVGALAVDLPSTLPFDIETMLNQMEKSIFGSMGRQEAAPTQHSDEMTAFPLLIKYAVRLDGGYVSWSPLVHVKLPFLKLGGEVSSETEVFLETVLNHVKVQYGNRSTVSVSRSEISLVRMAQLPEDVRMRILFFLNDLGPLEKALGIKRERNSFLRCRAVNKGIVKVAKRSAVKNPKRTKKAVRVPPDQRTSREGILEEISKLDEQALADLWVTHKNRSKARVNRARSNSDR